MRRRAAHMPRSISLTRGHECDSELGVEEAATPTPRTNKSVELCDLCHVG